MPTRKPSSAPSTPRDTGLLNPELPPAPAVSTAAPLPFAVPVPLVMLLLPSWPRLRRVSYSPAPIGIDCADSSVVRPLVGRAVEVEVLELVERVVVAVQRRRDLAVDRLRLDRVGGKRRDLPLQRVRGLLQAVGLGLERVALLGELILVAIVDVGAELLGERVREVDGVLRRARRPR